MPGNLVEATEHLIERYNPDWPLGRGIDLYPAWLNDVAIADFQNIEIFSFDLQVPYTYEAWWERIWTSAGVTASLPPEQVIRFDAELKRLLVEQFPDDLLEVSHWVFAVICQMPS